ncbi:hypothetical protein GCM10008949_34110 [Deinococcus humi]|nr:hypothetical protein GCM10008949_34110 [Deinococcus humi]
MQFAYEAQRFGGQDLALLFADGGVELQTFGGRGVAHGGSLKKKGEREGRGPEASEEARWHCSSEIHLTSVQ